jgi:hypothetical protein
MRTGDELLTTWRLGRWALDRDRAHPDRTVWHFHDGSRGIQNAPTALRAVCGYFWWRLGRHA